MGLHKPFDRDMFLLNGNVLTTGGSKNLAKGQFAIVDTQNPTSAGARAISTFTGASRDAIYEFRVGKSKVAGTRTAQNSKPYSSIPWKVSDIVDIKVSAPKTSTQTFDDLIVGYDGVNASTALTFEDGDITRLDLTLSGEPIAALGEVNKEYKFSIDFGVIDGQTNQEVVEAAVKRIKELTLPTGVSILNYIDVKIVNDENLGLTGTAYTFSTLTVVDSGDSNALGMVQAQYPSYRVVATDRIGQSTVYTILHPSTASLADYSTTLASTIKGCASCPGGYTELDAGLVYAVTIEDDGADLSTTVDDIAGFVTGTVVRQGNVDGKGVYTLVVTAKLTDAQIATFIAASAVKSTATFTLVGDVVAVCSNATATTTAWVAGTTCYASQEAYNIQLKDNECGASRLTELQAAYPDLVIEEGVATGRASRAITITGSSGDMSLVIAGTTYTTTYDTSPTVTATAFVTAHAAAILAATEATVTSSGAVITVTADTEGFPSITAVAGGLTETIAAINYLTATAVGGCQRGYSTTVTTNIVCDECSDIFLDSFTSVAPADYDFVSWTKFEATPSADAKMGIRLTGKPFIQDPEAFMQDTVPFYETSTKISVAGGFIDEVNYSTNQYNKPFAVKHLSWATDRDHLGANLRWKEDEARAYFDGEVRRHDNLFAKTVLGQESVLENRKQYVDYTVTVRDQGYAQSFSGRRDTSINYVIHVELGRHATIEGLVNKLATAAGLAPVQAFGAIAVS